MKTPSTVPEIQKMLNICGTFFLVSLWNTEFLPSLSEWSPVTFARKNIHHEEQAKNIIQTSIETQNSQTILWTPIITQKPKQKKIKVRKFYLHISELEYQEFKLLCWFLKVDFEVFHILVITLLLISSTSSQSLSKVWRCWDHGKNFQQIIFWLNHKIWQLWIHLSSL